MASFCEGSNAFVCNQVTAGKVHVREVGAAPATEAHEPFVVDVQALSRADGGEFAARRAAVALI